MEMKSIHWQLHEGRGHNLAETGRCQRRQLGSWRWWRTKEVIGVHGGEERWMDGWKGGRVGPEERWGVHMPIIIVGFFPSHITHLSRLLQLQHLWCISAADARIDGLLVKSICTV